MKDMQQSDRQGCACDRPEQIRKLISVEDALSRISEHVRPLSEREVVPLAHSLGRVLAMPVCSAAMVPAFSNAAMDGYAIRSSSLASTGPWDLVVTQRLPAGVSATASVGAGQAVRIFTGAPVPNGADAVLPQEDVRREGDRISFHHRPAEGLNIRRAGSDMNAGDIVLNAGHSIGPRAIAACAAAGAGSVVVRRPLRVGLLVTGDEIRPTGTSRQEGAQIWDVNTPMLTAALSTPSLDLSVIMHGADTRDGIARQLADLSKQVDLIITTGGISVGEEDHVKPALLSLGGEVVFSGVAIKPGKPVSFGRLRSALWLGLPGNPLAAFVTWQLFGRAILRALLEQPDTSAVGSRRVVLGQSIQRKPGRTEYRLAALTGCDELGREVVSFHSATHSDRVGDLPNMDGVIVLPADRDFLPEGTLVEFQPYSQY